MKAVILAGGFGTRISEETGVRPKPLVEIGDQPILWHIMKIFSAHGVNDFIICLGYKGYAIKEFFSTYSLRMSDVTYDFRKNRTEFHHENTEPWRITLVETGLDTMTGGRIKRIKPYVGDDTFCLTYGDGLCDVNINELINFHKSQNTLATLTAVQPPGTIRCVCSRSERGPDQIFQRKTEGRWRLDQRRFFCFGARSDGLYPG